MTATDQTPEQNPAESPTTPMPAVSQAEPVAAAPYAYEPSTDATAPLPAQQPQHHHGVHVAHRVSEGAIAVMVIGAFLFAMLAFGVGWTARGAAVRFQTQRAGMMGQGNGQGFYQIPGHEGLGGGRGTMPGGQGGGRGYRRGMGQGKGGQSWAPYGQSQGSGQGGSSAPATVTPY